MVRTSHAQSIGRLEAHDTNGEAVVTEGRLYDFGTHDRYTFDHAGRVYVAVPFKRKAKRTLWALYSPPTRFEIIEAECVDDVYGFVVRSWGEQDEAALEARSNGSDAAPQTVNFVIDAQIGPALRTLLDETAGMEEVTAIHDDARGLIEAKADALPHMPDATGVLMAAGAISAVNSLIARSNERAARRAARLAELAQERDGAAESNAA